MPVKIGDLELYNVEELAQLFGVQEKTIRALFAEGKLKGRKLAKRWYITAEELRDYFSKPEADLQEQEA